MKTVNHIRLTPDDMEEVIPIPHLNLRGIIEDACYRPKAGHPYLLFSCHVEDYRNRKCRFCGSTAVHAHGQTGAPRRIHDVNSGRTKVDIDLTVQRYICSECGRSFSPPSPDIMESRHLTRRLYDEIRHEAFTKPLSTVAQKYGYSDTIIGKIFDEYSKELDSAHGPVIAPRVLGIDEKHIVHNMRAIFTDIENRVLLEMCPDNKKDTVIAAIESMVGYDTNIEVVTMDMSCGYRTYVQECLPNAAIVVDKFHVCQSVYEKIAKARSKIMAYIGALIQAEPESGAKKRMIAVRNLAQTNTYLFKFNAKNLAKSERRISAMANICATFPEFNHLRLIKERFDRIYTAPDRRTAEVYCKEWAELIPPSGCRQIEAWKKRFKVEPELFDDLRSAKNTLTRKWHEEIFNYFEPNRRFTNAVTEGLNRMVEDMSRMGNGYSFERLRARALYSDKVAALVVYTMQTESVPVAEEPSCDKPPHAMGYMSFLSFSKPKVHWETVYSMKPEFAPQEDSLLAFSNYVREDDDNDECPLQNEDFAAEEQEVE